MSERQIMAGLYYSLGAKIGVVEKLTVSAFQRPQKLLKSVHKKSISWPHFHCKKSISWPHFDLKIKFFHATYTMHLYIPCPQCR